ncbi:MAG: hypothetical protein WKG07_13865 [Hymenobacter sp.]
MANPLTLKATLADTSPAVWRRLTLPRHAHVLAAAFRPAAGFWLGKLAPL